MPLVLIDAAQFDSTARLLHHAGQHYRLERVQPHGGRFHPKVTVLTGDGRWQLAVGSANLTLNGMAHNAELVGSTFGSLPSANGSAVIRGLREFLEHVRDLSAPPRARDTVDAIAATLYGESESAEGPEFVHSYESSIADQFVQYIDEAHVRRLTVLSPYWDDELEAVRTLAERVHPEQLVILAAPDAGLPANRGGLESLSLPVRTGLLRVASIAGGTRTIHAKALWAELDDRDVLFYGSANCTRAGMLLSVAHGGNVESGVMMTLPEGEAGECILDPDDGVSVEWLDLSAVPVSRREEEEEEEAQGSSTGLLSVQDAFLDGDHIIVQWTAPTDWDIAAVVERQGNSKRTHGGTGSGITIAPLPAGRGTVLAHVETLDQTVRSPSVVVTAPQGIPSGPPGISEADYREAFAEGGVLGLGKLFDLAFRVGEVQESWLYDLLAYCDISLFFQPKGERAEPGIGSATTQAPPMEYATGSPQTTAQAMSVAAVDPAGEEMDVVIGDLLDREERRIEALRKKGDRLSLEAACSRLLIVLMCGCIRAEARSAAASKGIRRLHNLMRCWTEGWRLGEHVRGLEKMARITPSDKDGPTPTGPSHLAIAASEAGRAIAGAALGRLIAPPGEHIRKLDGPPVSLEEAVVGPYGDWVGWYDAVTDSLWA